MRKFKFLKLNKKQQRGVALVFALGMLGLMVALALMFAGISFSEQKIARGSSEQEAAKVIAKSAVNRVIAVLENNTTVTDTEKIVSGGDPNNNNHYDYLWKLITHHGDVPGAGEMKDEVEKRIKNGTNSPYWQYILAPNKDGKDEIVGRFAYIAYQPVGLLDPYLTAKTNKEGDTPIKRYGMAVDEIDLRALVGVTVVGGNGALTTADINKLGENNADTDVSSTISTPAALFERFSDGTKSNLENSVAYIPLRNRLTAAWFSVPRTPAQPDKFSYKIGEETKDYHRFNLNRSLDKWSEMDLYKLMSIKPSDSSYNPLAVFNEGATKDENLGVSIPWFRKNDDDTRQIAANFLAYFMPIPKNATDLETLSFWQKKDNTSTYTANMRTPYLNEVLLNVKLNMVANPVPTIEGDESAVTFKRIYTVEITPEIDIYVELADLYKNSMKNINSLSFTMNALKELKSAASTNSLIVYQNGDFSAKNENLRNVSFSVNNPSNDTTKFNSESALNDVFPVYMTSVKAAVPMTITITVQMQRKDNGDGTYGDPACAEIKFSEPLEKFIADEIKVFMEGEIKGGTGKIPLDLAKISDETTIPILGEKLPPKNEVSEDWKPFELKINTTGVFDSAFELSQSRSVVLQYRAIDSAANLKKEHWVQHTPLFFKTLTDITSLASYPGFNNYAELKDAKLLELTENTAYKCNNLVVEVKSGTKTTFLVDKEKEPANKESLTGYGAVVSTSYIRGNVPDEDPTLIQSPWEIGFIHRGSPYQTLNIKRFNPNATEIGEYEKGDANIFDYLKISPLESNGEVLDENKFHSRGLVNLQKISRQGETTENAGNLPAAWAFFSNIDLGWTMDPSTDKFTIPSGDNWADNLTQAKTIVSAIANVVDKKDFVLSSRAAILDPKHGLQTALVKGETDAEGEELIGRFIMLTTSDITKVNEFSDFLVVTAIAQRIQIVPTMQLDKTMDDSTKIETGYAFRNWNGLWEFKTNPSLTNPSGVTGDDRLKKFYPGYDKILSSQKVVAWLRKNANGKWYIERLDYVD